MHPLRETIKISGKRERGGPGGRHDGRCRALICNSWFGIRNVIARAKPRSRHSSLRFPFRNICVLFESRLSVTFYPSPHLSLVHPFSLFFDHLSFHFSCHFSFLACPCFHLLLLSPFPLSSILHPRPRVDWRAFEARAENFEKENQRRGRRDVHRHTQPPFLRALRLFTAGAEGTRLRAYVRAKSVSKICTKVAPMGEGGGSSVDTRRKRKFARDRDTCSRPLCEISTEERESERSITR